MVFEEGAEGREGEKSARSFFRAALTVWRRRSRWRYFSPTTQFNWTARRSPEKPECPCHAFGAQAKATIAPRLGRGFGEVVVQVFGAVQQAEAAFGGLPRVVHVEQDGDEFAFGVNVDFSVGRGGICRGR